MKQQLQFFFGIFLCLIASNKLNAQNRQQDEIDVKHLALDLRFNWQQKQVYGYATITLCRLSPGNRYWFPCHDVAGDLRTTSFTATVDTPLSIISNGLLVSVKTNSDGTRSYHYKADQPYPNFLTSFAAGSYTDVQRRVGKTIIHTFCYPNERAAAAATIARLPDMIRFFSAKTGVPYPYQHYSQVMVQDYPFPGLVAQHTASIVSENMIDDYRTRADFYYLWDGVEAQALASQWYGNLIAIKDWSDAWLNQSFAHYFDGAYNMYKNGPDEFLLYYASPDLNTVIADWQAGYRRPVMTTAFTDTALYTSDNYTSRRGALVLRLLQQELGEDKWWKLIQQYTIAYAGKQVTTRDFENMTSQVAGQSMHWFFDQWIYQMGHPVFSIHKTYNKTTKTLELVLKQLQEKDTGHVHRQPAFFQGRMRIEIDGQMRQVWLAPKQTNRFVFHHTRQPKLVHTDAGNYWIKEIQETKPLEELLYQLEADKDILGKQWALAQLLKIARDSLTAEAAKMSVYNGMRKVILSKAYWRFRGNTLFQLRGLLQVPYDSATTNMLLTLIKNDKPWVKTGAITFLGMTKDRRYEDIYLQALTDTSERVINAAAIALGKTNSPKAYDALMQLKDKPSWKNQSLISALNGLKELGDQRAVSLALSSLTNSSAPHWNLATAVWDHRLAAAETLVALGRSSEAYPAVFKSFTKAMEENDINDIFYTVLQITTLADSRGQEAFDLLKERFSKDANAMLAVNQYEEQFHRAVKRNLVVCGRCCVIVHAVPGHSISWQPRRKDIMMAAFFL